MKTAEFEKYIARLEYIVNQAVADGNMTGEVAQQLRQCLLRMQAKLNSRALRTLSSQADYILTCLQESGHLLNCDEVVNKAKLPRDIVQTTLRDLHRRQLITAIVASEGGIVYHILPPVNWTTC